MKVMVNNPKAAKELESDFAKYRFYSSMQLSATRRNTSVPLPGHKLTGATEILQDIPLEKLQEMPLTLHTQFIDGVQASFVSDLQLSIIHLMEGQPGVIDVLVRHVISPQNEILSTHDGTYGVYVSPKASIKKLKEKIAGFPAAVDFVRLTSAAKSPRYMSMLSRSNPKMKRWLAAKKLKPGLIEVTFSNDSLPALKMSSLKLRGAQFVKMIDNSGHVVPEGELELHNKAKKFRFWTRIDSMKKISDFPSIESFRLIRSGEMPKAKSRTAKAVEPLTSQKANIHEALRKSLEEGHSGDKLVVFFNFGRKVKDCANRSAEALLSKKEFELAAAQFLTSCEGFESIEL